MSQHDLTIDNQGFPAFRADLNNALQALGSTQSGTTAPSPTFANQLWYDTTNNQLKIRNEDNDAWITLLTLDQTADSVSQLAAAIAVLSAGSASAPSLTTTGDTNTGIFFPAADTIAFAEGGVEAMRIDSSGNVGIGTSSPALKLSVVGSSVYTGTTNSVYSKYSNTGSDFWVGVDNSTGGDFGTGTAYARVVYSSGAYPLVFSTNDAERMRITSAGNVGIGTSSPSSKLVVSAATDQGIWVTDGTYTGTFNPTSLGGIAVGTNGAYPLILASNTTERMRIDSVGRLLIGKTVSTATTPGILLSSASGQYQANTNNDWNMELFGNGGFRIRFNGSDNGTSTVGSITSGTSSTSYTTTSDYRLKENITPMTGALDKVKQLKPCNYTWKSTGEAGQGFIAHELQAVVPDAVTGEKDAVNEDGSINPQGVDTSFLVATLTAAIQEQQAMIEELKQEVALLKSK